MPEARVTLKGATDVALPDELFDKLQATLDHDQLADDLALGSQQRRRQRGPRLERVDVRRQQAL